jgi:hypothetical protein
VKRIQLTIMLDQLNFKPTKKLCSYWSSLPQSSFSLGKIKIPALFSEHKSVVIEYTLFIVLILFETFTIFYLEDQGVTFVIMAILAIVEIIIAVLPLLWQNKQNSNKTYVEAQIFVSAIKLKWSNPNDEYYNNKFSKDKKDWENKLFKINLITAIFTLVITGFGFWKFWTYYELLGNLIFTQLIGRFILISIVLGIFVHLFATKTVFLNLLMKNRLKKELNQFYAGLSTSCDTDDGYTMIDIPLNIFSQKPSFVKFSVKTITNSQDCRAQILERLNSAGDNNLITVRNIKSNGGGDPVSYTESNIFSDGATLLYTKLLRDKDIQDLMNVQGSSNHYFEQEIIAAYAKEQQLNKYI